MSSLGVYVGILKLNFKNCYQHVIARLVENKKYEEAFIYDKQGNFILYEQGNHSKVLFYEKQRELIQEHGYLLIHNHFPEDWSISLPDFGFASKHQLGVIIAVTYKNIYSLKLLTCLNETLRSEIKSYWDGLHNQLICLNRKITHTKNQSLFNNSLYSIQDINIADIIIREHLTIKYNKYIQYEVTDINKPEQSEFLKLI